MRYFNGCQTEMSSAVAIFSLPEILLFDPSSLPYLSVAFGKHQPFIIIVYIFYNKEEQKTWSVYFVYIYIILLFRLNVSNIPR